MYVSELKRIFVNIQSMLRSDYLYEQGWDEVGKAFLYQLYLSVCDLLELYAACYALQI